MWLRVALISELAQIHFSSTFQQEERAISRSVARESNMNAESDATPVMIMMTRLLPSLATQNMGADSILARTYALHAFGVLVSNSIPTDGSLTPEQIQIVWKAVEAVESR